MDSRRYKTHGAVGGSKWETGSTLDMFNAMPTMGWNLRVFRIVPPIHILNELLRSGRDEAGMSGGCEWKPFEISKEEYTDLVEELITSPEYQCDLDSDCDGIASLHEWRIAIIEKYGKIVRDRLQ